MRFRPGRAKFVSTGPAWERIDATVLIADSFESLAEAEAALMDDAKHRGMSVEYLGGGRGPMRAYRVAPPPPRWHTPPNL